MCNILFFDVPYHCYNLFYVIKTLELLSLLFIHPRYDVYNKDCFNTNAGKQLILLQTLSLPSYHKLK